MCSQRQKILKESLLCFLWKFCKFWFTGQPLHQSMGVHYILLKLAFSLVYIWTLSKFPIPNNDYLIACTLVCFYIWILFNFPSSIPPVVCTSVFLIEKWKNGTFKIKFWILLRWICITDYFCNQLFFFKVHTSFYGTTKRLLHTNQ